MHICRQFHRLISVYTTIRAQLHSSWLIYKFFKFHGVYVRIYMCMYVYTCVCTYLYDLAIKNYSRPTIPRKPFYNFLFTSSQLQLNMYNSPTFCELDHLQFTYVKNNSVLYLHNLHYSEVSFIQTSIECQLSKSTIQLHRLKYVAVFVSQARAGCRPARTWLLEIAVVCNIGMCACVCPPMYVSQLVISQYACLLSQLELSLHMCPELSNF